MRTVNMFDNAGVRAPCRILRRGWNNTVSVGYPDPVKTRVRGQPPCDYRVQFGSRRFDIQLGGRTDNTGSSAELGKAGVGQMIRRGA